MRESVLRMVVVVTEVTTATSEEWGVRESVLRMVARASKLVSGKVKYEDTRYIMYTNWKRARSTTLCVRRRGVQRAVPLSFLCNLLVFTILYMYIHPKMATTIAAGLLVSLAALSCSTDLD